MARGHPFFCGMVDCDFVAILLGRALPIPKRAAFCLFFYAAIQLKARIATASRSIWGGLNTIRKQLRRCMPPQHFVLPPACFQASLNWRAVKQKQAALQSVF
jgi:hypothetical protein